MKANENMVMKRIVIMALMALTAVSAPLSARQSKEVKDAAKAAKETARSLRKDGFAPLEYGDGTVQLEKYFSRVNAGCEGFVGTADGFISVNLAKMTAQVNVANEYALASGGRVRGRVVSTGSRIGEEQVDDIVAAYERLICRDIRGDLMTCATFVKSERGGRYSVRVFCVVDEDAAHSASLKAMQRSLEETGMAEEYGSMVSDWIDEGMDKMEAGR